MAGVPAEGVDEVQESVVQCLDCMHDQPHLTFQGDRVVPIEDRWERMVAGTPWVASCTVTVDQDRVETCSRPGGDRVPHLRRLRRRRRARVLHPRPLPQARRGADRRPHSTDLALRALAEEGDLGWLKAATPGPLEITSLAEESTSGPRLRRSALNSGRRCQRIVVVAPGDVTDPQTWSGSPAGLFSGLVEAGVEAIPVDARPPATPRLYRRLGVTWTREATNPALAAAAGLWVTGSVRAAGRVDGVITIGSGYELRPGTNGLLRRHDLRAGRP